MPSGESNTRKRRSIWKQIVRTVARWLWKRNWLRSARWLLVGRRAKRKRARGRSISDRFYEERHGVWPWVVLVMLGATLVMLFGSMYFYLLLGPIFIERPLWYPPDYDALIKNSGIWTFLLALLAAPLAWYLWLIRDRNRLAEFSNTRLKELREYFYKLQEWATDSEHPSRQVTALFQLRDFLRGDRVLIPRELAGERRRFVRMAREFIVVLLRNRALWESAVESGARSRENGDRAPGVVASGTRETESVESKEKEPQRHPVQAALEEILIKDGFRLRDLSRADLAKFELARADLHRVNLTAVNFHRTNLRQATLAHSTLDHANFHHADLTGAELYRIAAFKTDFSDAEIRLVNLRRAQLSSAIFKRSALVGSSLRNSNLSGVLLDGADLTKASLVGSRLHGASFSYTIFTKANLSDARIAIACRGLLTDYTGTPIWCDDETGEPLDPQPDAESPPAAS